MGRDLLSSYEQELGDLRGKGLDYLAEWLPRLLVDSFKLAEQVTFTQVNSREVSVSITKPTFEMLCLSEELTVGICDRVGCQIQGSIGEAITKATEQNVAFGGCVYDAPTRTTTATYRMYPV